MKKKFENVIFVKTRFAMEIINLDLIEVFSLD
jgi:hypothetical protein